MDECRIVITGITGFVGRHLALFLQHYYPSCIIIGVGRNKPETPCSYDFHSTDLLCALDVEELIQQTKPDYIFHLAGLVFSYDWDALYRNNVTATGHLLEAVKKARLNTHVIITGSASEYGIVPDDHLPIKETCLPKPQTPYGMTKVWQTLLGRYYHLADTPVTVARIFNIIAYDTSHNLSTGDLFLQIQNIIHKQAEPCIRVGNMQIRRDFLDIEDVCAALVAIAWYGAGGEIYNICSGFSKSLGDILDLALTVADLKVEIITDTNKAQNAFITNIYGCNAKIKQETGWKPTIELEKSIKTAIGMS